MTNVKIGGSFQKDFNTQFGKSATVPAPTRGLDPNISSLPFFALLHTHPPRPTEILLLAWGVFFIARQDSSPRQKARNFAVNAIQKGKRPAGRQGSSTPDVRSDLEHGGEQEPGWSTTYGGPHRATGINNCDRLSAREGPV